MNRQQINYRNAKNRYETVNAEYIRRTAELDYDNDFDAACEQDATINRELGWMKANEDLRAAETALVNWFVHEMRRSQKANRHANDFQNMAASLVTARHRLAEIAMKVEA